jgi:hypothetical protein
MCGVLVAGFVEPRWRDACSSGKLGLERELPRGSSVMDATHLIETRQREIRVLVGSIDPGGALPVRVHAAEET